MNPPRPHLFARSGFAKACDRLITQVWDRGWDTRPPLEPDYLWKVGSEGFCAEDERAQRSEADVADFRARLNALCASLRQDAALGPLGHTMAYGQIRNAIRKRHALGRLWRRNPELADTPIAPPIIVLGQMRSGTTRVQRLLAADPALAGTRFCDSHDPVPAAPDLRPLKASAGLFMARRVNPWLDTFHPFGARRTDEEIGWLSAALSPAAFEAQWRIASYVAWNERRDAEPVYREFARILRTDAAAHANAQRPRVLKCPQFAEDMGAMLRVFPKAAIVQCERAHDDVLASSVSMVASQMAFQSSRHCADRLEEEWRRKIAFREGRMETALAGFEGPLATVSFSRLNAEPLTVLQEVYDALGMEFGDAARDAARAKLARFASSPHRQHKKQIGRLVSAGPK